METEHKTLLILWLVLVGSIVLCAQPFDFVLNLVGFVLAAVSGFGLIFLRRQIGRGRFIIFELFFMAAIGAAFVNMSIVA